MIFLCMSEWLEREIKKWKKLIKRDPELARYSALSFTNGYTSQGPMTIEESKSEMKSVVSEYRRYNELFSRPQSIPNE